MALSFQSILGSALVAVMLASAPLLVQAEGTAAVTADGATEGAESRLAKARTLLSESRALDAAQGAPSAGGANPQFQSDAQPSLMTSLQGLVIVLGVFFVGVAIAKRFLGPKGGKSGEGLRVVSRLPLTPRTTLLKISVDGTEYLVTVGGERVAQLVAAPKHAATARQFDEVMSDAADSLGGTSVPSRSAGIVSQSVIKEDSVCASQPPS